MNKVKKGRALRPGDVIGIVGLSSPTEADRVRRGLHNLSQYGFKAAMPVDPSQHYGKSTYLFASGDARSRIEALRGLYSDSDVAAVLSARGGYGAIELLEGVDFQELARFPKPLVGLSDATVFLITLYQFAQHVTIHGPSLESSFSKLNPAAPDQPEITKTIETLLGILGGQPVLPWQLTQIAGSQTGEGPLIGGNLTVICSLMGTRWEPDFDNHLVFFEDVGEKPYRIHRALTQLKLAGKFRHVRGVVLGNFDSNRADSSAGIGSGASAAAPTFEDVFKDIFRDASFPVVTAPVFGHQPLNLALPIGVPARVSGGELVLLESAVLD